MAKSRVSRHNRKKDNTDLCKNELKRLSLRSSVVRVSSDLHAEVQKEIRRFLDNAVRRAFTFSRYRQRRTVMKKDVEQALRVKNIRILGY